MPRNKQNQALKMPDGMRNGKLILLCLTITKIIFNCVKHAVDQQPCIRYLLPTNAFCFGLRWEKYDAKGWTEKGAHKYGRLNEQSWWEKWGEHYDGRGSVLKWFALFVP